MISKRRSRKRRQAGGEVTEGATRQVSLQLHRVLELEVQVLPRGLTGQTLFYHSLKSVSHKPCVSALWS